MFAVLWTPDFRLQAALRWRDLGGPLALVDGEANRSVLLEVNAAAAASWVQPGLTAAQALARCPKLRIVSRSPAQEAAAQALLAELALAVSPHVEATAPGVMTLDLSGASRVACWQRLAEELVRCAAAEDFLARVGVAPHPDHAWLAACRAEPVNVVYDGAPFCAALPLDVLAPSPELRAIFEDWGIRTVGEFLRLPAKETTERLGTEAARLRLRASGRRKPVLRLVRPAERYGEAFDFDYAIETSEPLLFLLRRFVDGLSGRLRAAHRVAAALTLTLPMDGGPDYARTFTIPSPTADADAWYRILTTHLESLTLDLQPVGVRLDVTATNAAGRQLNLFESALRDPNKFGETLAQLKALVGERSVGVPQPADTHRPGAFRVEEFAEVSGADSEAGRAKGLALRRQRPPRFAAVKMENGLPSWMEAAGPILRATGPYRTSGEWWERGWEQTEWDVELANGDLLRLALRADGRWQVEGAYETG